MKIILTILLTLFFLLPLEPALAQGLVACEGSDCNFCSVVQTTDNIIQWLIILAIIIATISLAIAGIKLVVSQGNSSAVTAAKDTFFNVVIGIFIVLIAWTLVDVVMKVLVGDTSDFGVWNEIASCGGMNQSGEAVFKPPEQNINESGFSLENAEQSIQASFTDSVMVVEIDGVLQPAPGGSSVNVRSLQVPPQQAGKICYSSGACFTAVTGVAGIANYRYPSGFTRVPPQWIDTLNPGPGVNLDTKVSANYTLRDFNVSGTCGDGGRYMYISPRAVAGVELVNQILGTVLDINSGHRSPDCNGKVGGATESYHMTGLAVDMQPGSLSRSAVVNACKQARSGFQQVYNRSTHVHCDWR